ncbi:hypothetical protein NIES2109_62040 (plasmid) [Nostoc sp. HK-01]|nr:hypothetical protein NIES2109_62040 [Nostoc sp. HK-01]
MQNQFIFNQKEMTFLILFNANNDWSADGFLPALKTEHIQTPRLTNDDFEQMMLKLQKMSLEYIEHLILGLNFLDRVQFFQELSEQKNKIND